MEETGQVYKGSPCIISYSCMWIRNYHNINFSRKMETGPVTARLGVATFWALWAKKSKILSVGNKGVLELIFGHFYLIRSLAHCSLSQRHRPSFCSSIISLLLPRDLCSCCTLWWRASASLLCIACALPSLRPLFKCHLLRSEKFPNHFICVIYLPAFCLVLH